MRAPYVRETWLRPFPCDARVYPLVLALTEARIEGKELATKRPSTLLRVGVSSAFLLRIEPKLVSSPTGWRIAEAIPVKLAWRVNEDTEAAAKLLPNGQYRLSRWRRDDARNRRALDLLDQGLARLADDPRAAFALAADHCGICGRGLTDPVSRQEGIGPECRGPFERAIRRIEQLVMDGPRAAA